MLLQDYVNAIKPIDVIDKEEKEEESKKTIVIQEKPKQELFMPRVNDKLFCCIYIVSIGLGEFYMIGSRYKNAELREKQTIMNYMLKNKTNIKATAQQNGVKMTNIKLQNIQSELMTDTKTTWYTFWVLCFYYKLNAIIIHKDVYMEFNIDSIYDTYLFERNDDLQMTVDCINISNNKITQIKANRLRIDPFVEKILKGVSSYKITELQSIMEILKINCDVNKPKKNDLYDTVIKYLVSMNIQN